MWVGSTCPGSIWFVFVPMVERVKKDGGVTTGIADTFGAIGCICSGIGGTKIGDGAGTTTNGGVLCGDGTGRSVVQAFCLQLCFRMPFPPNLGLLKQLTQLPQSSVKQPLQVPHFPLRV